MSKKFSRIVSVLLTIVLLCVAVFPVFAAEVAEEDENVLFKPKLAVKVETDEKIYGTDDEIVFKITVTNIGLGDAKRVFVETKSHKHLDLDDDQQYIVVGDLAAGESKTVELYGRYTDETNATLMSNLFLKAFVPIQEFIFTMYATVFAPMFNSSNMSYCEVNIYDFYDDIDKDYGVLVFAKYGNLPGEVVTTVPATEAPTDAPVVEEPSDFAPVNPEVTDSFEEVPSDYAA